MRNPLRYLHDLPYRLMAGVVVSTAGLTSVASAAATGGFGTLANNVNDQFEGMGKLLLGGSFIGGVGMFGAGLLKLKAAADSGGQQVKYGEGIWRLGVGSGLVALPTMALMGKTSLYGDSNAQASRPSGVNFIGN